MLILLIKKLKNSLKNLFCQTTSCNCRNKDEIYLSLDGLEIVVNRSFAYDKPHEVSVFVPRAELRKTIQNGDRIEEVEVLLNSITVVHSPQRSSDEEKGIVEPPDLKPPELPKEK